MPQRTRRALGAALLLFPLASGAEVVSRTLDNGLEVLVQPDHRAPVVTAMVWYRVGGIDEPLGRTGISHVLEHLMFQGTENLAPGEYAETIARHGGDYNAFTAQDYTAYYATLASDRLEVALRLEADRMAHGQFSQESLAQEVKVVQEERRTRVENSPSARAQEALRAVAYDGSAYAYPVVGWMKDLENLELAEVQRWYERYYTPSNARLVIAGDVRPERAFRLAEQFFGDIPDQGEPAEVNPNPAVPARGQRSLTIEDRVRVPRLSMVYGAPDRTTAEADWELAALRLAAGILSGGRSARLPAELVRGEGVATSAGASFSPYSRAPRLFKMAGTPAGDSDLEALQGALEAQIRRLREETVAAEELERVKRQIRASVVFRRDSVAGMAREIGMLETIGYGHEFRETYLERIESVTPEQIHQVARKYLVPERRTVMHLEPEEDSAALEEGESDHAR